MIKFSDLLKSFLLKIYLLVIIFVALFGVQYIAIKARPQPQAPANTQVATYTSAGQMSVWLIKTIDMVDGVNIAMKETELIPYINTLASRMKGEAFMKRVINDEIKVRLQNPDKLGLEEKYIKELKNINANKLIEDSTITATTTSKVISIKFKHTNAKVAQFINDCIIDSAEKLLIVEKDVNNILNTVSAEQFEYLRFAVDTSAQLPLKADEVKDANKKDTTTYRGEINILKTIVVSVILWLVVVAVYEFAIGYLTSTHKAKTLIQTDVVSEITIPVKKVKKQKEGAVK